MTARHPRTDATSHINNLRRGASYVARTAYGIVFGEYLGIETPYGDRAILLRNDAGTNSIPLRDVRSIRRLAWAS